MLKKFLSAAALCFTIGFAASAQDAGGIKPGAGAVTGEVQLSLTDGNTVGLGLNQLRGRYFLAPNTALRASFILDVQNQTADDDFSRTSTLFVLAPGIEKHFAGTDRLSPYVGAEISFAKFFASEEADNYEIEGGWSNGNSVTNRNYFGFGLGAVAGADYYFAQHVYLGVEFGFGLQYQAEGDVEINPENGSNTTLEGESGSLRLRPNVNTGLRLGFVF
ncbi:outer membrane beta-barrel protein [Rufibacter hautae]|uniref:Porin family protein n=1 Tax=Rufibacter hautae TaxID=2595005 RepID=A0A5B6TKR5_9BACT|nr:outer membrane beta-barrel protein [Rufibacter hautae]KAA3439975.1 porin family protein [Rufibacter hautae]